MEVYLDNSATTRCLDSVAGLMIKIMCEDYGNPSSMHNKGVQAEQYLRYARTTIARNLKVNEKEIYFTSGGTESDNLALIGTAIANQRAGRHLITTCIEHPAVLQPMKYLENMGFEVTYLPVDKKGRVSTESLRQALRPDTILVSMMHTNNEIGSLQPVEEAAQIVKSFNSTIVFHVDGVQGYGKYRILPKKMGIDLLSVSGHKIHGPKGVGFLYVNERVKITPVIFGGGQQKGLRSGTENVPGIAGLAKAVEEVYANLDEDTGRMRGLKEYFIAGIQGLQDIQINGSTGMDSSPHIISISIRGIRSEVLLHALEERGIYVSAGSACASNKPAYSATLKAMGVEKELLDSTLRFSLSLFNTKEEIDYTLQALYDIIPMLRKYTRH
ncbi:MAG: cysteine desulfurase [Lachnospiraceae bacterium]|nr:cysteine desulfurase [Lachnospiraceae bacterium]MDD7027288.1 cysteine desulfurase family protein [Lachnospiraceae bacterium]MDY5699508.1 cysteine desulfurase family protein [Lachnospiraceae bacterium]